MKYCANCDAPMCHGEEDDALICEDCAADAANALDDALGFVAGAGNEYDDEYDPDDFRDLGGIGVEPR